jgi:hypothetical protein
VTAAPADATAAASNLAAHGYILTATGLADSGNVFLLGTRVQGDTLPRPFASAQGSQQVQTLQQQGYAVVAVFIDLSQPVDPYTYIGER